MADLFSRILCPIDFSPNSAAALEIAGRMAERSKGAVTLLYALPPALEVGQPIIVEPMPDAGVEAEARLKALAADKLNRSIPYDIDVVVGDAASEIIEGAVRHHCDTVVMATHGRTGLKHFFLGSVAERVVHESAVPVLTIRAEAGARSK